MTDLWIENPAFADTIARAVPGSAVRVTYSSGAQVDDEITPPLLAIAICNSPLNDSSPARMEEVARELAPLALTWLRDEHLAQSGTQLHIAFCDKWGGDVVFAMNALETFRFEVSEDGALRDASSGLSADDAMTFRAIRRALSGR